MFKFKVMCVLAYIIIAVAITLIFDYRSRINDEEEMKKNNKVKEMNNNVKQSSIKSAGVIPRNVIFSDPDKWNPSLSPNGEHIAYIASINGVMNIYIAPSSDITEAKPVTTQEKRNIRGYSWTYDNKHIIYFLDNDGDENYHIYRVNIDDLKVEDLTPFDKTRAHIYAASYKHPERIIIGLNNRDQKWYDIYELSVLTGELKLLLENNQYIGFVVDENYDIRFAERINPDGSLDVIENNGNNEFDRVRIHVPFEDVKTAYIEGFDKTGNYLYLSDSRGRNTAALYSLSLQNEEQTLIGENQKADIGSVLIHPTEKHIQAYTSTYLKRDWYFLDREFERRFNELRKLYPDEISIVSTDIQDNKWIISYSSDIMPAKYFLYDATQEGDISSKVKFLFSPKPVLENYKLQPMQALVIKSRDKLDLVSYLTLPEGKGPHPLVLWVHGGPHARDYWGIDGIHQWLASRGYAVLNINYRGSSGFGKEFGNKSQGEWGRKMHDDLIDGVEYLVKEGVIDPKRVAIVGGSYGGYATLVGLTFTPEFFTCGVDIVGMSSLLTMINNMPDYWLPAIELEKKEVGDPDTEEGRELLISRSPLYKVDQIVKPLLIMQGVNDPRVKVSESRQIIEAMNEKNIPVVYMEFPKEGHGFSMAPNRLASYAAIEAFLHKYLNGKLEDISQEKDYKGAEFIVPSGLDLLPEAKFPVNDKSKV